MNSKVTGIVGYIGWIGWIIAFLAGDKEGAKFHLNQSLVLNLLALAGGVVSIIPILGAIVASVVSIAVFVFWIMGIVSAIKEEEKELPLIGKIQILK